MKIAVSIPTPLFEEAERKAHKMGIPRSKLYAQALELLLKEDRERRSEITRQLDEVYSEMDSSMDPAWKQAQSQTIAKYSEW
ncbi:MAG TPA: ChpI protein [Chloroflexota bacterium]|nr:ChpI protein [Chloroflexota bacterium]